MDFSFLTWWSSHGFLAGDSEQNILGMTVGGGLTVPLPEARRRKRRLRQLRPAALFYVRFADWPQRRQTEDFWGDGVGLSHGSLPEALNRNVSGRREKGCLSVPLPETSDRSILRGDGGKGAEALHLFRHAEMVLFSISLHNREADSCPISPCRRLAGENAACASCGLRRFFMSASRTGRSVARQVHSGATGAEVSRFPCRRPQPEDCWGDIAGRLRRRDF